MANFEIAIKVVLGNEGLYSNDPLDKGGETKYGISRTSYPDEDIPNLTIERATEIYRTDFWAKIKGDEIRSQTLATKVLDMCVLMGIHQGITCLQRATLACHSLNIPHLLEVDGMMGPATLSRINAIDDYVILPAYRCECAGYFRLVIKLMNAQKYEKGWLNRAYQ